MESKEVLELVKGVADGSRRDLARAITAVEEKESVADQLLAQLPPSPGTFRLGITGAPGVGKSTLIANLVPRLVEAGERVAVLAIDPTSPVSGGAVLGDRARISGDLGDDSWFRSIATRGATGGIAGCTDLAAEILARGGFTVVIIETVGVGQLEVEIAEETDHAWLLLSPESGDAIQLLKGGVLEVIDRVLVHKCDRQGSEELLRWTEEAARDQGIADPLAVSSVEKSGIDGAVESILKAAKDHREHPDADRARARLARRIRRRAEQEWLKIGLHKAGGSDRFEELVDQVASHAITVPQALQQLLSGITGENPDE